MNDTNTKPTNDNATPRPGAPTRKDSFRTANDSGVIDDLLSSLDEVLRCTLHTWDRADTAIAGEDETFQTRRALEPATTDERNEVDHRLMVARATLNTYRAIEMARDEARELANRAFDRDRDWERANAAAKAANS